MTTDNIWEWSFEICGIKAYHNKGFKGQGITIINHENNSGHSAMTTNMLKKVAPEAKIINANVTQTTSSEKLYSYNWKIDGKTYNFEEMYNTFKPDIISTSFIGTTCKERDEMLKGHIENGDFIMCCATGNNGAEGVQGVYRNVALNIGACSFRGCKSKIDIMPYSGRNKDNLTVDYVGFMGDGSGTSNACPFVAGQIALFMCRYGKVSQNEFKKIINPYCIDLGDVGRDYKYGDGLIVLPEELKQMNFKDVEPNRWSKSVIDWAADNGIVNGFEDNTFRPEQYVTREQLCAVLKRYDELKRG